MTQGEFQSQVNVSQAPAVAGDFASKNPRYFYDAGPGGLVSGPAGVTIGRFAWAVAPLDADGAPATVYSYGAGVPTGFVHREQQGLITTWLASYGMTVQPGFGITLCIGGDLWVINAGTTEAEPGMKAYANNADGSVSFALTGATTAGGVASAWTISAQTYSVTGSIADDVLTVTVIGSGTIYAGTPITGSGVAANTTIVKQLTGAIPGGTGTYLVSIGEQTVASTTISGTYGLLTLTTIGSGTFAVGQTLTGASAGVTAGTTINQFLTGVGNVNGATAVVNYTQTSANGTQGALTSGTNTETKWYARSTGLVGELVKISEKTLG
jgi:hypothetical protein